ncbi:MAG: DUF5719 family protein [Acidimicrobiales bacterium]
MTRRAFVLGAVAALLAGGAVADRVDRPSAGLTAAAARRALMPSAAPADALSSSWFCVGPNADPNSPAAGVVVMANPTDRPATGTLTVVPTSGEPRRQAVEVPARSSLDVTVDSVGAGQYAAALVDLDAGQVAVELVMGTASESEATPCSSRASERWYFADGSTAKDATLLLALFNPFPEDAIVDLSFSTDQGRAAPAAFRPVVVPGRALVVKNIGEHVRRRESIATSVLVRTGRVVAAQTQVRTVAGKAGVSTALGAPSLGADWHFASGMLADGVGEHYAVYNPNRTEAAVLFRTILDEGVAEDFERTVPAQSRIDVVLNEEVGVPRGVGRSTTVQSLDGVRVVVARSLSYGPPSPLVGRTDTLGARRAATRWAFPAGGASETTDEYVVVSNPGSTDATLSLEGLAGAGGAAATDDFREVKVGAGRRAAVRVRDHVARNPMALVLTSSAPVVAERVLYQASPFVVWSAAGIPLE